MQTPAAEMKGSAFSAMVHAVKSLAPDRWEALLQALSLECRRLVSASVLSTDWVPIVVPQELRIKTCQVCFDGDMRRQFDLGAAAFRNQNSRIFRIAYRFMSPEFMMGKIAMVWHGSYRNHGTVKLHGSSSKHCEIMFNDVVSGSELYWIGKSGVLFAAAQAIGGKDVSSRVLSMTDDGLGAVVRADWK